jgi:hypothetical protein
MEKMEVGEISVKVQGVWYAAVFEYPQGYYDRDYVTLAVVVRHDDDNELTQNDLAPDLWKAIESEMLEKLFEEDEDELNFEDYGMDYRLDQEILARQPW